MKFAIDPESTGWLLTEISEEEKLAIIQTISEGYYPNEAKEIAKEMGIENRHDERVKDKYVERVMETANSIFDGNYQAYIDRGYKDEDYLVIEPEYGFGAIELKITDLLIDINTE